MSYKDAVKRATRKGGAKVIGMGFHKMDKEGDCVVGLFADRHEVSGRFAGSRYIHYIFETDDGPVKFRLGSASDQEYGSQMEIGEVYSVTFKGKESISGNRYINRFEIVHIPAEFVGDDTEPVK